MKTSKQTLLLHCIALMVSIGMIAIAEVFGNKEIIFPEIVALVIGSFLAPNKIWNVKKTAFFILMCTSSLLGLGIVRYLPLSTYIQCLVGFTTIICLLTLTKTTLFPAISACLLPILLHTETMIYPLSVGFFTGIILIIQYLLEKIGLKKTIRYEKKEWNQEIFLRNGIILIVFALLIFFPVQLKEFYFITPPLIVTFVEFCNPESPVRHSPVIFWLLLTIAGTLGFVLHIFVYSYEYSPVLCSGIILCILFFCFYLTKKSFPPAGAICFLPLLLPSTTISTYPFKIMIGSGIFILCGMLIGKYQIQTTNSTD